MPTRDRRAFVAQSIAQFLAQDYPAKELVIIDSGESVRDLVPDRPDIRYSRADRRRSIGELRNLACSRATGDIILHWDDDDWYAPGRITTQVWRHLTSGAAVTGYRSLPFADDATRRAWLYSGRPRYVIGTSLCYSREYWASRAFESLRHGEDNAFVSVAPSVYAAEDDGMIVARVHGGNTCQRAVMLNQGKWSGGAGQVWREIPYADLTRLGYPNEQLERVA
jgi:glycosyltransferase involved in cell wall biosynthesis